MKLFIKKFYIGVLIVSLLLIFACVFMPEIFIRENGQWFYAVQFFIILITLLRIENNYLYFFSPSFLCLAYLNLNFFLGHIVVSRGIGIDMKYYQAFRYFESVSFITAFFIFSNLMVFLSISFDNFKKLTDMSLEESPKDSLSKSKMLLLFTVLFVLGQVNIDFSFLGGAGDFSYTFKLAVTIIIVYFISNLNSLIKYLSYIFIILLFFVGSFSSKREFFYIIILILFFEFIRNRINIKIKLRQMLYFVLGFFSIFYLVVTASILRGYGNFEVENPIEASEYVLEYISSDFATNALAQNFELNYLYGNSSNAMNYVFSGKEDYLFGSTFLKFLFIPIPRSVFPGKPSSMIDVYTNKFAPNFRKIGGSYPVIIYAESFWNFSLLAFPFLFLIFQFFNRLYLKIISSILRSQINTLSVFLIFMYVTIVQFIRGSGFDLWLLYGILQIPFTAILLKILRSDVEFGRVIKQFILNLRAVEKNEI